MSYKTQGERIAAKIKRDKMSATAVARALQTSPQNVRVWVAGFCVPSMKFHDRIEAWLRGTK